MTGTQDDRVITSALAARLDTERLLRGYRLYIGRLAVVRSWRYDKVASQNAGVICQELTNRGRLADVLAIEAEYRDGNGGNGA